LSQMLSVQFSCNFPFPVFSPIFVLKCTAQYYSAVMNIIVCNLYSLIHSRFSCECLKQFSYTSWARILNLEFQS
jgi:hypothetical protein